MATISALHRSRWWQPFLRLVRFGIVGGSCCLVQIVALVTLVQLGLGHELANGIALVGVTQLNFLLSAAVIWHDRPLPGWPRHPRRWVPVLLRRMLGFNTGTALTLLLNEAVFALSDHFVPYVLAALCGIAVAAPLNFLIEHYLIFRPHAHAHAHPRATELETRSDAQPELEYLPAFDLSPEGTPIP